MLCHLDTAPYLARLDNYGRGFLHQKIFTQRHSKVRGKAEKRPQKKSISVATSIAHLAQDGVTSTMSCDMLRL